jgi:hypothetical protein
MVAVKDMFARMRGKSKHGTSRYAFSGKDVAADIFQKYRFEGDLLEIYSTGTEQLVHKWQFASLKLVCLKGDHYQCGAAILAPML